MYCIASFGFLPSSYPPATLSSMDTSQIYFHRSSMAVDRVRTIGAPDRPGPSFVKFMTPQPVLARVLQDF